MPKDFNKHGRNCLSITLLILVILQITIGLIFIIIIELYKRSLAKFVGPNERSELQLTLLFMEMFGVQFTIYYCFGIFIIKKLTRESNIPYMATVLSLWHSFIFIILIIGFLMAWMILRSFHSIEKSTEISLMRGIEMYYSNPEWRLTWDDLQYHQECCGVKSYKDWGKTVWVEESFSSSKDESACDSDLNFLTPYSCCRKSADCFENLIPEKAFDSWIELPTTNISSINEKGCLLIYSRIFHSLLIIVFCISVIILLIEVLLLILMKIFYVKSQDNFSDKTSDQECQATIVVKCPHNFRCEILPDSDAEPIESIQTTTTTNNKTIQVFKKQDRKSCLCKTRRKVTFACNDEYSSLLLH